MSQPETKERILDAAQELFAGHGIDGTSLRAITREAGVNLAAVHYHFGSKEGLIRALFSRLLGPVNAERLALLDRVEEEAGDGPAELPAILEAFVGPAIRVSRRPEGGLAMQLLGRSFGEPAGYVLRTFKREFREVARRFAAALCRALPHLPRDEVYWRLSFAAGAMSHTMSMRDELLKEFFRGEMRPSDPDRIIRRLVVFLVGGLDAPTPSAEGAEEGGEP